jgi:hypothetical protein
MTNETVLNYAVFIAGGAIVAVTVWPVAGVLACWRAGVLACVAFANLAVRHG